jgi:nitrous oxidase accessory protein NosD
MVVSREYTRLHCSFKELLFALKHYLGRFSPGALPGATFVVLLLGLLLGPLSVPAALPDLSFQSQTAGTQPFHSVAFDGSQWLIAGGEGWDNTETPAAICASTDASSWSSVSQTVNGQFRDIGVSDGQWLAVGLRQMTDNPTGFVAVSEDGAVWSETHSSSGLTPAAIVSSSGISVLVGATFDESTWLNSPYIAVRTTDDWTSASFAISASEGGALNDVIHDGSRFIAVGEAGESETVPVILTSATGTDWSGDVLWDATDLYGAAFEAVAHGPNGYVAVGSLYWSEGKIWQSSDLQTWSEASLPTSVGESFTAVTYGDGLYVAVGGGGLMLVSEDGQSWTEISTGASDTLYDVAVAGGKVVAVGDAGTVLTAALPSSTIRYVNDTATGNNDGTSWANAFTNLTSALSAASDGDNIWVAEGTYRPTGTGRSSTFAMIKDITLHGGFPEPTDSLQPKLDDADVRQYATILCGDIGVTDVQTDNVYHVVEVSSGQSVILDSLHIVNGFANGSDPLDTGAGVANKGNLTMRNCLVYDCSAIVGGGLASLGTLHLEGCEFHDNGATGDGDSGNGGAVRAKGLLTGVNCLFANNHANRKGGAIFYMYNNHDATLTNCTFIGNSAGYQGGAVIAYEGDLYIANSIFWDNTAPTQSQIFEETGFSIVTVSDSCVQDGWNGGTRIITQDPLLDTHGQLLFDSPCIDAGDASVDIDVETSDLQPLPTVDAAGNPRISGQAVDLGAYERQPLPAIVQPPQTIALETEQSLSDALDLTAVFTCPLGESLTFFITNNEPVGLVTASLNNNKLSLTANAATGTATLTLRAVNSMGTTDCTVSVNVVETGIAPELADVACDLVESAWPGDTVRVLSAVDPNNQDTLTYTIIAGNEDGIFALDAQTGTITLADYVDYETAVSHTLTVQVTDSYQLSDTGTLIITILDRDDTPIARDDAYECAVNELLQIDATTGLLSNDRGGNPYEPISVSAADTAGCDVPVSVAADGSFTFDPREVASLDELRQDGGQSVQTFTYTLTDSEGQTASATVTVTVSGEAPDLIVPDDHATLQAAVDAAQAGDLILVRAGTYVGELTIAKQIRLLGEDKATTIIDGQGDASAYGIQISADGVEFSGFTIQNMTKWGICLNASNCAIEQCVISSISGKSGNSNTDGYGVYLNDASNNTLESLTISDIRGGGLIFNPIVYDPGRGIHVSGGAGNTFATIAISDVTGGTAYGVSMADSANNLLSGLAISNIYGEAGENIDGAKNGYSAYGVHLDSCAGIRIESSSVSGVRGGRAGVVYWFGYPSYGTSGKGYGVYLTGETTAVIGGNADKANRIYGNGTYALYNDTANDIDAAFVNWDSKTPDDEIFDQLDDATKGRVASGNWLYDNAPDIASATPSAAVANTPYSFLVTASDEDGDALSFAAADLPDWLSLTDNGDNTASLAGTPTSADLGDTEISVTVSGGPLVKSDTAYYTLEVVKNLSIAAMPSARARAGVPYADSAVANLLVPGEAITLTAAGLPDWLSFTDNADGTASLTGTPPADGVGDSWDITITAATALESVEETITLTIAVADAVGLWSGAAVNDVVVKDDLAFALTDDTLYIIDGSDPYAPQIVGRHDGAGGTCLALEGDTLAVGVDTLFGILDVSDPTAPTILKSWNVNSTVSQMRLDGNLLFVRSNTSLLPVDISDPLNVVAKGWQDFGSGAGWSRIDDFDVEAGVAYLVDGYDMGLQIKDFADPENPVSLDGWFDMWEGTPQIDVVGDTIYLTRQHWDDGGGQRLYILPVADPDAPTGYLDLASTKTCLSVRNGLAYLACANDGARVIDVGNASSPAEVHRYSGVEGTINGVAVGTNHVYIAGETGLFIAPVYQTDTPPSITAQPQHAEIALEGTATFHVSASGSATFAYQWYRDGDAIAAATSATFTIAAVDWSDAASYTCTVSNAFGSDVSQAATLTVLKKAQTIALAAFAAVTYGDEPFDIDAGVESGLPLSFTSSNPEVATVSDEGLITVLAAGQTEITASQAGDVDHAAAESVSQTLTVAKKALVVTADDQTITYGDVLPEFTVSYDGLLPGDSVEDLDTPATAAPGNPQQSGPITPQGGSDDNYAFTQYVAGTLTVNSAPLTIRADDKRRRPGHPNPAFSAAATGLVNGDTLESLGLQLTFDCAADLASPVGHYAITVATEDQPQLAYEITWQPGVLTVVDEPAFILYVNADASSGGDGGGWSSAFRTIGEALARADVDTELWIAQGTYSEELTVPAYVSLYGGFRGSESECEQRDWRYYPTTVTRSGGLFSATGGTGVVFDGLRFDNVTVSSAQLRNCLLQNGSGDSLTSALNCIFSNYPINQNGLAGTFERCVFYNCHDSAILGGEVTAVHCTFVDTGDACCPVEFIAGAANCIFWLGDWMADNWDNTVDCFIAATGARNPGFRHAELIDEQLVLDLDGPDDVLWTEDDGFNLTPGSVCIDAGEVADSADILGRSIVDDPDTATADDRIADLGAYEYQGALDSIRLAIADGWNLLALPFSVSTSPLTCLVDDNASPMTAATVWQWDAPSQTYTLWEDQLASCRGVWAYGSKSGLTKLLQGDRRLTSIQSLDYGWNLIGVAGDLPLAQLSLESGSIAGPAWQWNGASGSYQAVESSDFLRRGIGYWVFVVK